MIYGDPNDAMLGDYPPGHPAGTDEFVSVGAALSGRGMGTGGVLGTRSRATEAPTHPNGAPTTVAVTTGPTVLIAVDGGSASDRVVRSAHRLFGDDAAYLAINVGPGPYTEMSWAYVWPVATPSNWSLRAGVDAATDDPEETAIARASAEAAAVARDAGLTQATPLGDVGDPTTAIVTAAHHHHADVVVIGADSKGWLGRLIDGSVERSVLKEADFAVLVVDVGTPIAHG